MNLQKLTLMCVLMLACSLTATASEVYKRVNEDGIVEFSDTPSNDADRIDVNPNVIETNPVSAPAPASSTNQDARSTEADTSNSLVTTETVEDVNARERAAREERLEQSAQQRQREAEQAARDEQRRALTETNRESEVDDNPGRATRNAIRNAPGR